MWEVWIHNTRSGSPERQIPVSAAKWNRRLGSLGSATHSFATRGSGLPKSLISELTRGNKYTIVQRWGNHVAYAGVIRDDGAPDNSPVLPLRSKELRAALFGARLPHGVNEYVKSGVALSVANRSWAAALRAVLNAGTKGGAVPGWELPIDLPADSAGSFTAAWLFEEGLFIENMIGQIEDDGAETDLAPYLTNTGYLRYTARAAETIVTGSPLLLPARAPGSIVTLLDPHRDVDVQRTGVLAFGNGTGEDRLWAFAPQTGDGIRDMPVQDVQVTFPDITDQTRLQAAADAEFRRRNYPIEQWGIQLHVGGYGPSIADVGRILDVHVFGSERLADGVHPLRVIGLTGDLSMSVTPEVQKHG